MGQISKIKERIEQILATEPDVAHGLMALYEETEDYTCLTLKAIRGKREKGCSEKVF
ncbi:hypothetical protein IG193_00170 [Infirmifilum lucidum]|uniref:Uncharacterized protein n=1 Tax=Infirmifilum lucidum TaxID=2776706 RepID=A0A7L9FGH0_9CREN|nr:hypothetical protein [Infirmifilum lucidum]QOJ78918.1 hypothetical protein IG193_00170 [Infirmifilum lucidum]